MCLAAVVRVCPPPFRGSRFARYSFHGDLTKAVTKLTKAVGVEGAPSRCRELHKCTVQFMRT